MDGEKEEPVGLQGRDRADQSIAVFPIDGSLPFPAGLSTPAPTVRALLPLMRPINFGIGDLLPRVPCGNASVAISGYTPRYPSTSVLPYSFTVGKLSENP